MLVTQFAGIVCTGGIVLLDLMPDSMQTAHLALNMTLYVIAMFLLRAAVMCNNSLLVCFEKESMTVLSLLANFLGFAINLVGLLVLTLWPEQWFFQQPFAGITPENWWTIIFTSVVLLISPVTFLCPSGERPANKTDTDPNSSQQQQSQFDEALTILPPNPNGTLDESAWQRFVRVIRSVTASLWETFARAYSNLEYRKCWLFLIAYLFFSSCGTVVTIYIGPLFIDLYDASLDDVVYINLYYKIAMVCGVVVGMAYQRFVAAHVSSLLTLALHNVVFMMQAAAIYIAIVADVKLLVELLCYSVGLMYGWNASVARGLFSSLIPDEKKSEFMGLYSSLTYLAISGVSVINIVLGQLELGTQVLLLVVLFWSAPAFIFLLWLSRTLSVSSQ